MATGKKGFFHRVSALPETLVPNDIYYVKSEGLLFVATSETTSECYSGIKKASWSASTQKLTLTPSVGAEVVVDLSAYAKASSLGDLGSLNTTAKGDLVSAINEVLAAGMILMTAPSSRERAPSAPSTSPRTWWYSRVRWKPTPPTKTRGRTSC